jgi:peptidylprolyl isomerase
MRLRFSIIAVVLAFSLFLAGGDKHDSGPTKVEGPGFKLPNGLRYWDVVVGTGMPAVKNKRVRVHYTGWLLSGRKFDSSRDSGHPFVFQVGGHQVIPGWDEGIVGMKEGGRRQLRVPPELAYGNAGAPPEIPPNATLIFDIELLNVER